jgi:hypothetical protein
MSVPNSAFVFPDTLVSSMSSTETVSSNMSSTETVSSSITTTQVSYKADKTKIHSQNPFYFVLEKKRCLSSNIECI